MHRPRANGRRFQLSYLSTPLLLSSLLLTACGQNGDVENKPPTADAGNDQSTKRGARVTLDGSGSTDPNGDKLRYRWNQIAGTPVTLEQAETATPSFTAPDDGEPLTFSLVVSDGHIDSAPDTVNVQYLRSKPPRVSTGAQIVVRHHQRVELKANLLSDDASNVAVRWRQTYGKRVNLENNDTLNASFTAPEQSGVLIFEIGASNQDGGSHYDSIAVHVTNQPPMAVAKTIYPQVGPGDIITLDGSESNDPDGDPLVYRWKQVLGSPVAIDNPEQAVISFSAPEQNDHLVFTLSVSDGEFSSHLSRVHVKVKPLTAEVVASLQQAPSLHDPATPINSVLEQKSAHWSYSGTTGPAHWGMLDPAYALCGKGHQQSPINISNAEKDRPRPIEFHYKPSKLNLLNNGHTVQLNYDAGSYIIQAGKRFDLQHLHFHAPSEHTINGQASDMVVHLVHKAEDGQLAVVALMLNEGDNNEVLEPIWQYMPNEKGEVRKSDKINVTDLLPKKRSYYHYIGSLTTPPCSENVSWNILLSSGEISAEQISQFKHLFPASTRLLQPLNNRVVRQQ